MRQFCPPTCTSILSVSTTLPLARPLAVTHHTVSTCAGHGSEALWQALCEQKTSLKPCDFLDLQLQTWIGEVAGLNQVQLPARLRAYDCRNNRLAALGLQADGFDQAVLAAAARFGPSRVGVFLGTSSSGLLQTELAYRRRDPLSGALPADFDYQCTQDTYSLASFVRALLGLNGPAHIVSTACSSSAKVFASAERMIRLGLIDAAVVGGVDSLCQSTICGFHSLELTSTAACRPYDQHRDGVSVGEGAAFALLMPLHRAEVEGNDDHTVTLCGYGESSDAHHMSSPHPEGLGAQKAMRQALARAGLAASQIGYVNLHGTATPNNDAAEGAAVLNVLGANVPCSSTKGLTGHALGAAGAVEAIVCIQALQRQTIPGGMNTEVLDPSIALNYALRNRPATMDFVLSNSFGFGGSNCSLVFGTGKGVALAAKGLACVP